MVEAGFKGWLLVLAIFQGLLLLRQGGSVVVVARDFVSGVSLPFLEVAPFSALYGGRLVINGLFLALVVVATALMGLRRRAFVRWGKAEMTALMVLPVIDYAWILIVPWSGRTGFSLGLVVTVTIYLAVGLAWRRYIEASPRVAATFVR